MWEPVHVRSLGLPQMGFGSSSQHDCRSGSCRAGQGSFLSKNTGILHPVPKFQPNILGVIFVHLTDLHCQETQHNVDKSIQNICCELSFGSAKAELVRRALGQEFMVAFPHSHGHSPSAGCRACRVHLSCSSPFIWHSAPTGRQESENSLCYDTDLQILEQMLLVRSSFVPAKPSSAQLRRCIENLIRLQALARKVSIYQCQLLSIFLFEGYVEQMISSLSL